MVQDERRSRRQAARREEFVVAATRLAAEEGIESLTMKALADAVDCAVGTAYSYFPSKGALVAAVQAAAIGRLATAYDAAAAGLDPVLADLDEPTQHVARLIAFGRFIVAADRLLPNDFRLQQQLLGSPVVMEPDEAAAVVPVAFDLLGRPQELLVDAIAVEALADDAAAPSFERAVTWVASVNGVLSLQSIQVPVRGLFDTAAMADRVTLDLLAAWGADAGRLARASDAVPSPLIDDLLASVLATDAATASATTTATTETSP